MAPRAGGGDVVVNVQVSFQAVNLEVGGERTELEAQRAYDKQVLRRIVRGRRARGPKVIESSSSPKATGGRRSKCSDQLKLGGKSQAVDPAPNCRARRLIVLFERC